VRQRPLTVTPSEWENLCRRVGLTKLCAECGIKVEKRVAALTFGFGEVWRCPNGHEYPVLKVEKTG
jgi:hypothetical protein